MTNQRSMKEIRDDIENLDNTYWGQDHPPTESEFNDFNAARDALCAELEVWFKNHDPH